MEGFALQDGSLILLLTPNYQCCSSLIRVRSLDLDVGEGTWSEHELVKSTKKRSHEGVGLGDVDFASVVNVELSPGSWEEFGHVGLHLGLRNLLGNQEDLSAGLLSSVSVENLLTGWDSSGVHDWHGVVVEDVVVDIVLISSLVS